MSKNLLYLLAAASQNLKIEGYYFLAVPSLYEPFLEIFCFSEEDGITAVPIDDVAFPESTYAVTDVAWGGKYLALTTYPSSGKGSVRVYKVEKNGATRCTVNGSALPDGGIYSASINENGTAIVFGIDRYGVSGNPPGYGNPYSPQFQVCGGTLTTPTYWYDNPDYPPDLPAVIKEAYWPNDPVPHYAVCHIGAFRNLDTEFTINAQQPDAYWLLSKSGGYGDDYHDYPTPYDIYMSADRVRFDSESLFAYAGGGGSSAYVNPEFTTRYGSVDLETGKICYKLIEDTTFDYLEEPIKQLHAGPSTRTSYGGFKGPGISIASGVYGSEVVGDFTICSIWGALAPAPELWIYNNGVKLPAISDLSNYAWGYNGLSMVRASMSPDTLFLAVPTITNSVILYFRDGSSFTKVTDLPAEWSVNLVNILQFSGMQK